MQRRAWSKAEIEALKPKERPYGVAIGIPNVRVHVAVSGAKTYQVRVDGTVRTLGKVQDVALSEVRLKAASGDLGEEATPSRSVGEWMEIYLTKPATKALVSYTIRAASLRMVLGPIVRRDLKALTTDWAVERFQLLAKGDPARGIRPHKPRSIKTYQIGLTAFVNWLVRIEALQRSPFMREPLPRLIIEPELRSLSEVDVDRLERECGREPDDKLACFVLIALHCGLRRTEILTLQRDEIHLDKEMPYLTVLGVKAKNRRRRHVGISPSLAAFLRYKLPLLPDQDPFMFRNVDAKFRAFVSRAEVGGRCTPHTLRHTCCTSLLRNGVPINVVQAIMGHTDIRMTSLYATALQTDALVATNCFNRPILLAKAG